MADADTPSTTPTWLAATPVDDVRAKIGQTSRRQANFCIPLRSLSTGPGAGKSHERAHDDGCIGST